MSKAAILCVDDEVAILESLGRTLRKAFGDAYLYEFAENAEEALEIVEELHQEETEIIAIISDWLMPGIKGDELLLILFKQYPKIITILLTGQADQTAIERAKAQANLHAYLSKPWDNKELIAIIKSGLEKLA